MARSRSRATSRSRNRPTTTKKTVTAKEPEPPTTKTSSDGPEPDPAGVAARIRAERGGEGEGDGPRMVRDRQTGRMRPARPPGRKPASFDYADEPDETDVQGMAGIGSVVWGLVGPLAGLRPLTEAEALKFGRAAAPVAAKWLPALNDWGGELALLMTVVGLVQATRVRRAPSRADEAGRVEPTTSRTARRDPADDLAAGEGDVTIPGVS